MPTDLQTIAQSAVRVRYKEPLLSEALNRAQFVQPRGTYRGFNLGTSASALSVTVEVDPVYGDAVAVVHDVDDRALTIRVTDSIELDLSSFASKTVVIAIYARHLSQGTTVAAVRGYELDPTDEYTGDLNVGNLIVLGTVVVPAAGLIAASSITHEKRVVATDNEFSQRDRIPLLLNHDFQQTGYPAAPYITPDATHEGDLVAVGPHWFAEGGNAAKEGTQYKADGSGLIIRSSASGDYEVSLYQDLSYTLGDIDASNGDWKLHYEVNYDVIAVSTGGDGTLEFRIYAYAADNDTATYLIQKSLDVTSTGTGLVVSGLEDLLTTPPDFGAVLGSAGTVKLSAVMFAGSDAVSQVNTDLYRINSVQVWLSNNAKTAGHRDPQARGDKGMGWPWVRGLSFLSRPQGSSPATAALSMEDLPNFTVSQDSRFGSGSVLRLVRAALSLQEVLAVEDNNTGADRNKPRFRGAYNDTLDLTNILEAVSQAGDTADSGLRLVASPNGRLYLAVNADTSNGVWDKDIDGDPAAAIRIDGNSGEVDFLTRAAGAGTWNDSSWTEVVDMRARRYATLVLTDGVNSIGGDVNGVDAIDSAFTAGGKYILKPGEYTLSASITTDPTERAEILGELSTAGVRPIVNVNAGIGQNFVFNASGYYENIEFRNVPSTALQFWFESVDNTTRPVFKNCKFRSGELHFEGAVFMEECVVDDVGSTSTNSNCIDADLDYVGTTNTWYGGRAEFLRCKFENAPSLAGSVFYVDALESGATENSRSPLMRFEDCDFNALDADTGRVIYTRFSTAWIKFVDCRILVGSSNTRTEDCVFSQNAGLLDFEKCTFINDGTGDRDTIESSLAAISLDGCEIYGATTSGTKRELVMTGYHSDPDQAKMSKIRHTTVRLRGDSGSASLYRVDLEHHINVDGLYIHCEYSAAPLDLLLAVNGAGVSGKRTGTFINNVVVYCNGLHPSGTTHRIQFHGSSVESLQLQNINVFDVGYPDVVGGYLVDVVSVILDQIVFSFNTGTGGAGRYDAILKADSSKISGVKFGGGNGQPISTDSLLELGCCVVSDFYVPFSCSVVDGVVDGWAAQLIGQACLTNVLVEGTGPGSFKAFSMTGTRNVLSGVAMDDNEPVLFISGSEHTATGLTGYYTSGGTSTTEIIEVTGNRNYVQATFRDGSVTDTGTDNTFDLTGGIRGPQRDLILPQVTAIAQQDSAYAQKWRLTRSTAYFEWDWVDSAVVADYLMYEIEPPGKFLWTDIVVEYVQSFIGGNTLMRAFITSPDDNGAGDYETHNLTDTSGSLFTQTIALTTPLLIDPQNRNYRTQLGIDGGDGVGPRTIRSVKIRGYLSRVPA